MTDEERKVMKMALDVLSPDPYRSEWLVAMDMDEAIKAIKKCLANDALEKKAENARELGLDYEPEKTVCPFCSSEWVTAEQHDRKMDRLEQEPVAWMFQHEETGRMMFVETQQLEWGFEKGNPRLKKIGPLYTSPPQRKPLTDEEIADLYFDKFSMGELKAFARAIEAAHGIGCETTLVKGEA